MKIITKSEKETRKLGELIAKLIVSERLKKRILVLEGELGGGKTTFLKGFAKGLGIKEKILSPTFILIQRFRIPNLKFKNFYHIDCYRIENKREILILGFRKIIKSPQNVVAIEWGDKIKRLLPKNALFLNFRILTRVKRNIDLSLSQNLKRSRNLIKLIKREIFS